MYMDMKKMTKKLKLNRDRSCINEKNCVNRDENASVQGKWFE